MDEVDDIISSIQTGAKGHGVICIEKERYSKYWY